VLKLLDLNQVMDILKKNLSDESKWILSALITSTNPTSKEKLWKLTNTLYIEKGISKDPKAKIISSRYVLDIHTARLEGAGLVEVTALGRIRVYSVSEFGKMFINHLS